MLENDLAFYTYFYGNNTNPSFQIPELPSLKYKCFYYTNNPTLYEDLKSTSWVGIFDNNKPMVDDLNESCMMGKYIKTMPQQYEELQNYKYLCFLDSKLQKVNESFVEKYIIQYFIKQDYALLLREHWFIKNNVWNEFHESMNQKRYNIEKQKYIDYIENQIKQGLQESTETHCACGFLIRNMKHPKIVELNNTWYDHIQKCGIQDQISFFFVKQLFQDCIVSFTEYPFTN